MYICQVHAWEFMVVLVHDAAWLFYCVPAAVDVLYVDSLALKQASQFFVCVHTNHARLFDGCLQPQCHADVFDAPDSGRGDYQPDPSQPGQ